jgi:apolipoprotein N-acyltransferase
MSAITGDLSHLRAPTQTVIEPVPWYRATIAIALAGSLLMWAAQPPLAIGWLAWVAPIPWLVLVRREQLPGRRPYLALYFAAFVFWLAAIHWLRLPHPALYVGWVALAAYLASYLPVFVGLSRVAVHRLRLPLWLAAPVVWTSLELARAHLLTGFLMGSIAHTQARWPTVIQIADIAGEYGVNFLILIVAASITSAIYPTRRPAALIPAMLACGAALGYGYWRLGETTQQTPAISHKQGPRIALIQGNSLADWKMDAAKQRQIMDEYIGLSREAVARARKLGDNRPVDLIVWPETMFRSRLTTFEAGYKMPPGVDRTVEEITAYGPTDLSNLVQQLDTPVLVGIDRVHVTGNDPQSTEGAPPKYLAYNSSVLVDRGGKMIGTYDKQHLVVFGEYVPFAKWFPILNRLSSVTGSAEAGEEPVALELDGVRYAPNICYETAMPHVIRKQVAALEKRDESPDVLVNLTNDAWYWGSSELDMHLACGVFRAVETRRPLVIAANGGISAWIDRFGRIRAESPHQRPDVILADVELFDLHSPYVAWGDWFAGLCLAFCIGFAIAGWRTGAGKNTAGTHDNRR